MDESAWADVDEECAREQCKPAAAGVKFKLLWLKFRG